MILFLLILAAIGFIRFMGRGDWAGVAAIMFVCWLVMWFCATLMICLVEGVLGIFVTWPKGSEDFLGGLAVVGGGIFSAGSIALQVFERTPKGRRNAYRKLRARKNCHGALKNTAVCHQRITPGS